ncbi:MAG: hypothetical protein R3B82_09710 [Sandaracinaceae bacterium]
MSLFSPSVGKRAVERAWLVYTPIWGGVTGLVMLGGFAERWGDGALMTFGVALALGTIAAAFAGVRRHAEPADRRAHARAALSMTSGVVVLAFGLNYFQTPYFFEVLHMRYGFAATWTIDRNPVFLYLVTIPYFATYSVLACVVLRAARRAPKALRLPLYALAPLALAFLETVLNANPFMTRLFCYDDLPLMLWFGTLSYGVSFVFALPVWLVSDEDPKRRWPLGATVGLMLLVVAADTLVLHGLRTFVAPAVTTVVEDATGGRAPGGCLEP